MWERKVRKLNIDIKQRFFFPKLFKYKIFFKLALTIKTHLKLLQQMFEIKIAQQVSL